MGRTYVNYMSHPSLTNLPLLLLLVLDPRISYEGLRVDYADDPILLDHLEQSRTRLSTYFNTHYARANMPASPSESAPSASCTAPPAGGSPQKSFTARYRRKEKGPVNELEEYFKVPAEDFDVCKPIQWWVGRQGQFPRLFQLARDIFSIPGELLITLFCAISYMLG
jgi:hypothetical protein